MIFNFNAESIKRGLDDQLTSAENRKFHYHSIEEDDIQVTLFESTLKF